LVKYNSDLHWIAGADELQLLSNGVQTFTFRELAVLKINLEKCRCIIGGPLSREFYTYGDVVVCKNFFMDVEK